MQHGAPTHSQRLTLAVTAFVAVATIIELTAQNPLSNKRFLQAFLAMNATNVASIHYAGTGTARLDGDDAASPVARYAVAINYGTGASRVELEQAAGPGEPLQLRQQLLSNGMAWNTQKDGTKRAAPATVVDRQRAVWMTPHGVIKAAQEPDANVTFGEAPGDDGTPALTVTLSLAGSRVTATIGATGLVERVSTMTGDPVLGDAVIDIAYSEYEDYDAIKFPTRIIETRNGETVLDLTVTEVRPNAGLYLEVPENVRAASN